MFSGQKVNLKVFTFPASSWTKIQARGAGLFSSNYTSLKFTEFNYDRLKMFKPKWKWSAPFFFKHQTFSLFFIKYLQENRSTSKVTKSLRKFVFEELYIFFFGGGWDFDSFHFPNGVFHTHIWTNWTKMPSKANMLDLTRWAPSKSNFFKWYIWLWFYFLFFSYLHGLIPIYLQHLESEKY